MANNLVARSLHDLGAAGWFGSVLMGAVAVNRAAGDARDPVDRGRVTNGVWRRWWMANAACIGAHVVGGMMLTAANKTRLGLERGAPSSAAAKSVVTMAAVAASAYSGYLGKQVSDAGDVPLADGTTPASDTPSAVSEALTQLDRLQWIIPALTGTLIVLGAQQGEQQRVSNVVKGVVGRLTHS
jgi:hypothetical protein